MNRKFKKGLSFLCTMVFVFTILVSPSMAAVKGGGSSKVGTLTGKVTTAGTNKVLAGAKITAIGSGAGTYTATTDATGTYKISLASGLYTVTCEASGYSVSKSSANIRNGITTKLDFSLGAATPTNGTIMGTVSNSNTGAAIAGVTISLSPGTNSTTTDQTGKFSLEVPVGTYTLTANSINFNGATTHVTINSGETTTCDLSLSPISTGAAISHMTASPAQLVEGETDTITLTATLNGTAVSYQWLQVSGPKVPLTSTKAGQAVADISNLSVAADVELKFRLSVTGSDGNTSVKDVSVIVEAADMFPFLGPHVQVGGSTTAAEKFLYNGQDWAIFNIGSKLCTTPISITPGPVNHIFVPGFVHDIELVTYNNTNYALLSCGSEGIVVVNISDPANMVQVSHVNVNYYQDNLNFTEGGGAILYNNTISGEGSISALTTDGIYLFIANNDYGIHRTLLTNLLGAAGPVLEEDGTLVLDLEKFTLQYAGENPWGGPLSLELKNGKLFATLGFLGLGIFDTATLNQVGRYNLYTDSSVSEDWFINMDVRQTVQKDPATGEPFVDSFTGMPDYRQTSYEILQVMKNDAVAPTPWADFDRYGKFYYKAQNVDIAEFNGQTIAYIAYSLGGLIAVDVTGYQNATVNSFLNGKYLGYIPAVPANGPKEPTGTQSESLLPYYGAGMLKESGVVDVQIRDGFAYLTDHFAGLVIVEGANSPQTKWKGSAAPYNNDTDGILGNHWPDYEFITSYDMSPWDPSDNESMPKWMYQAPCHLVTAEINGHGNSLLLMDNMAVNQAGNIDLVECAGAGGFNFVDLVDLKAPSMDKRYNVPIYFPPTNEIGAAADGSPTQTIAIGHSQSIAASDKYLYVSDGPHGISAWQLTDENGYPTDNVHLVGNTLQDEYPEIVNGVKIYPASHSTNVVYDPINQIAWSGSASLGLRRVSIAGVEAGHGKAGNPILLPLSLKDCFEHNAEWGTVKGLQYQDHAYDVAIKGKYAFVADGSNGITVYDYTKDPTNSRSGFVVSNVGAGSKQPPLGTASGIELWADPATGKSYAFVACGPRGVGVVNVTDVKNMQLVKVFEPIKYEDSKVGAADGQAVDVKVVGDYAYFTYDSFGVVCYSLADLIKPLPAGISPTDTWKKSNTGQLMWDYRPVAVSRFKLQWVPGYEDMAGGAFKMTYNLVNGKLTFYVGFAEAGVVKIDWTSPTDPILKEIAPTIAECTDVAISNGRVYAADGSGGIIFFK